MSPEPITIADDDGPRHVGPCLSNRRGHAPNALGYARLSPTLTWDVV